MRQFQQKRLQQARIMGLLHQTHFVLEKGRQAAFLLIHALGLGRRDHPVKIKGHPDRLVIVGILVG
jgi:hypothetical protein